MGRLGLGLFAALAAIDAAYGQQAPADAKNAEAAAANVRCASLGEGFFAVSGSSACMRISGHVSAGVGFVTTSVSSRALGAPATESFTEEGVSGDVRLDTPIGPGRIYVHVHNFDASPWPGQ